MQAKTLYFIILFFLAACSSQKKIGTSAEQNLVNRLKSHVGFLADDKLEGRRAGSNGEKIAREYIADQFRAIGIQPKGSQDYFQPFEIVEGKQVLDSTYLLINNTRLVTSKDYFPFPYSANLKVEALPAVAVQEADMPWFYDLKDILDENKNNPHFDLNEYIYTNAKKAREKGASSVILYNSSTVDDKLVFNARDKAERLSIPVIYIAKEPAARYFKDEAATVDIKFRVDIAEKKRTGHNVVGYIDNGAANTIVLGAHYDHLGYGEDGNSMIRTGEKSIHNGADDNASGTAALIELAGMLKNSKAKGSNYLFIAFSGEELGLFGSKYFVEHPTVPVGNISCMINMDMVGRLNDSTKTLTIGGIGTSPAWSEVLKPNPASFAIRYDSSGTGPSDHTSFYRKGIPVLFYFTGLHSDYHKPTDDAFKLNYQGQSQIVYHIFDLVEALNSRGKIAFTPTRESQTTTNASFKVTLGIMPDYTYSGTGVRADGVTENRPAAKAGLKTGDVIILFGDYNINSLEAYMQALGKFKKGDKTRVKYKRGNDTLEAMVEF